MATSGRRGSSCTTAPPLTRRGPRGQAPLHHAVLHGCLECVQALLEAGADPNAGDIHDATALHWVADRTRLPEVMNPLLKAGADINARDFEEVTPLHLAAQWGPPENVRVLLGAGADIEALTDDGDTPLLWGVWQEGRPETLRALLEAGANTEAVGDCGCTALYQAAGRDMVDTVRALLEFGADPNARDVSNDTALSQAARDASPEGRPCAPGRGRGHRRVRRWRHDAAPLGGHGG